MSEQVIFTQTEEAREKSEEFALVIMKTLESDDKFSWEKKRSTQPRKTHTGSRIRTLFQTMETVNTRLLNVESAPFNTKHEFDKINELIDSVLDSWRDKAENFLIAEIEEIYTTKDWRTLITFCQHMGTSSLIPPRLVSSPLPILFQFQFCIPFNPFSFFIYKQNYSAPLYVYQSRVQAAFLA